MLNVQAVFFFSCLHFYAVYLEIKPQTISTDDITIRKTWPLTTIIKSQNLNHLKAKCKLLLNMYTEEKEHVFGDKIIF